MNGLVCTLVGDGPSDRLLEHPIKWALRREGVQLEKIQWADFGFLSSPPKSLDDKLRDSIKYYPAELIFVHRDAEHESLQRRQEQIYNAAKGCRSPHVPVVPVRMTEAWFLHSEQAIRRASGNPNGRIPLSLPRPSELESVLDPKSTLFQNLLLASEHSGQRRQRLTRPTEQGRMRARVAELIDDFAVLTELPSFNSFLTKLHLALEKLTPYYRGHEFIRDAH